MCFWTNDQIGTLINGENARFFSHPRGLIVGIIKLGLTNDVRPMSATAPLSPGQCRHMAYMECLVRSSQRNTGTTPLATKHHRLGSTRPGTEHRPGSQPPRHRHRPLQVTLQSPLMALRRAQLEIHAAGGKVLGDALGRTRLAKARDVGVGHVPGTVGLGSWDSLRRAWHLLACI